MFAGCVFIKALEGALSVRGAGIFRQCVWMQLMTTLAEGLPSVFILEEPRNGVPWEPKIFKARNYQEIAYTRFMSNMPCDYVESIKFLFPDFPDNVSFVVEKFTSYLANFTPGARFCTLVTNDGRRIAMSDASTLLEEYALKIEGARRAFANRISDGLTCHDNPYLTVE